jgi:uncharacterized membrane protein YbaN (DUF454 family)
VGLAVLGILLPVMPTTVFLLLAAYCYGRGSPAFYDWLVNRSVFASYIRNYRDGKGIPLLQKVLTIALLWLSIGATILVAHLSLWLDLALLAVAAGVTTHLVMLKTRQPEPPAAETQDDH